MKKRMIFGNWKMNLLAEDVADLLTELSEYLVPKNVIAGICPSHLWIPLAIERLKGKPWLIAAQDVHSEAKGAFTGDISAPMLHSMGCCYSLVGHSERRQHHRETDEFLASKVQALLQEGMTPILCVGETLTERQTGQAEQVVQRQLRAVCSRLDTQSPAFPIAYEPVWAIGTGVNCDSETANAMMKQIRGELVRFFGESKAEQTHLLYGGSVKASNIEGYLQTTEINGALVGGASLQAKEFKAILEIAGGNIDV